MHERCICKRVFQVPSLIFLAASDNTTSPLTFFPADIAFGSSSEIPGDVLVLLLPLLRECHACGVATGRAIDAGKPATRILSG